MEIVTLGINLAKNIFALHGVDAAGKVVLQRPTVKRAKLQEVTASLPSCRIGIEARSGARHWARGMTRQGHEVRLIAPKFVVPYRLSGNRGKNDLAEDAAYGRKGFANGAARVAFPFERYQRLTRRPPT